MISYRPFSVKYIPPSNNRGAKICIKDLLNNKSVFLDQRFQMTFEQQARNYLIEKEIVISGSAILAKDSDLLLSENFDIPLK